MVAATRHLFLSAVSLLGLLGMVSAQCSFPEEWYSGVNFNIYYRSRTDSNPSYWRIEETYIQDLTASIRYACNDFNATGDDGYISATLSTTTPKRLCMEVVYSENVMFIRQSADVTRDDPYTAEECETVLGTRTRFNVIISADFNNAERNWADYPPDEPPAGVYSLQYEPYLVTAGFQEACVDPDATLTISSNIWNFQSTCITGNQTYANPLVGDLKIVGSLSDSALSISGAVQSSGLIVAAIDSPNIVPSLDYQFYIMRYSVEVGTDGSESMVIFFTTGQALDPTGYLSFSLVPNTERNNTITLRLKTNECNTTDEICKNSGTCIQGWRSTSCYCAQGFEGPTCEINIDECNPDPCLNNGTCTDMDNGYSCECPEGWSGDRCQFQDRCLNGTCENGGTCVTLDTTFLCFCADGFVGETCDRINECEDDDPCENGGTCAFNEGGVFCVCPDGFFGDTCELETQPNNCEDIICENGGTCLNVENGYYCECTIYYEGEFCENLSDWFIVTLVLAALLALILLVLWVLCCCYCCCGWRPRGEAAGYGQMDNSESSFKMDTLPPSTVEFNFNAASPSYGIQVIRK